jgi:non-ribosomal peptide synthetase component F/acyl carrier protein
LPLLASTKIDRDALTLWATRANATHEPPAADRAHDGTHARLRQLWCEVLGATNANLDFFSAGGDSLQVVRLPAAVTERFGVVMSARQFIESPRLEDLARQVDLCEGGGTPGSRELRPAHPRGTPLWTSSERFLINLPVSHREPSDGDFSEVLGDFTSVVLLSVEAPRADTFRERARRLQRQLWADLDHRSFDGVEVMRRLARDRGAGGLAPVVFTGLSTERDTRYLTRNCLGTQVSGASSTPQVWIDQQVRESDGRLAVHWDVVDALFPAGMIEDMFQGNIRLLRALATDEGTWHETFGGNRRHLVPPTQARTRARYNETERSVAPSTLPGLVLRSCVEHASRSALIAGGQTLTYRELFERATSVARCLRDCMIGPGARVAVVCEKGWQRIIGVLGVVFAGGAYVPISPSVPARRLNDLLGRSGARIALTSDEVDGRLAWLAGVKRLVVDRMVAEAPPSSAPLEVPEASPDALRT